MRISILSSTAIFLVALGCASTPSSTQDLQHRWVGHSQSELTSSWGAPMAMERVGGQRVLYYRAAQSTAHRFFVGAAGTITRADTVNDPRVNYFSPIERPTQWLTPPNS